MSEERTPWYVFVAMAVGSLAVSLLLTTPHDRFMTLGSGTPVRTTFRDACNTFIVTGPHRGRYAVTMSPSASQNVMFTSETTGRRDDAGRSRRRGWKTSRA
jgi:hypothetical protein